MMPVLRFGAIAQRGPDNYTIEGNDGFVLRFRKPMPDSGGEGGRDKKLGFSADSENDPAPGHDDFHVGCVSVMVRRGGRGSGLAAGPRPPCIPGADPAGWRQDNLLSWRQMASSVG
jgi:hypothetical protein